MNIDDLIIKYGLTIGRRFTRKEKNFFCNEISRHWVIQSAGRSERKREPRG